MTTASHHPPPPLVAEVAGPWACFTRPEFKTERFSYPVMTPSAARGILEAIFWKPEFTYRVVRIEVLQPIQWFAVRRNEVQSMTTLGWVKEAMAGPAARFDVEQDRDQRNLVGLRDVAYRIHAQVALRPHADAPEAKYRDQFRRRIERGACFSQPFLGTREFSASSFGPAGQHTPIQHSEPLGVMLHSIDYHPEGGETYRWFDAVLANGAVEVPAQGAALPGAGTGRTGGRR